MDLALIAVADGIRALGILATVRAIADSADVADRQPQRARCV